MRDDIPPAALKLMQQLPVRTHERKPPPPAQKAHEGGARQRGEAIRYGRGGLPQPIRIGRSTYASAKEAARIRKKPLRTIYKWIAMGYAEYVKPGEKNGKRMNRRFRLLLAVAE